MAGRRSHYEHSERGHHEQAPKQPRGNARGHGAYHRFRTGKEAPHAFGTGRDRTVEAIRPQGYARRGDEELADLSTGEKKAEAGRWVDEMAEASTYGARLEGRTARGTVIEVRKGHFLTRMASAQPDSPSPSAPLARGPLPTGKSGIEPSAGALPEGEGTTGKDAGAIPTATGKEARATPLWKGGDILRTFARGTLKQFDTGLASLVAPGDEVEMIVPPLEGTHELVQQGLHGILTRAFPRRNELRRMHPSGRSIQTICANVDRVYIMASAAEPEFRPGFVDRVLVCAESCGLPAALVFNKIDLGVKPEDEALLSVYRGLGLEVFKLSVANIDAPQGDFGMLKERLAGTRSVLTGHSGVGKSSLILALAPLLDTDVVPVGEVSSRTGKGIHTTTHAQLFRIELGDGKSAEVVDTPGVREFMPADTDRRNLWAWFPEIARLQGQCAYSSCTHTVEKDCAVLAAVARGEIHARRHQSYARIYQTLPV